MRATHVIASLAFLYAITASPIVDTDIVPENTNFAVEDELIEALNNDLSDAKKTIAKMTASGKSEEDCRKLVTETRKEVTDNVDYCTKTTEALPKGESCAASGQANVKLATEAKTKADKHVVYTKTVVTKTEKTEVHFGSRTFSSLTEGHCSTFFSSTSYTTAKMNHKAAVTAYTKAVGSATQASKSLKLAIEAAAKEKKECECKVKSDHESTFAKHSASNAANQKAWIFACKVQCVLDRKSSCKCSAAPMCKRPKVAPAVMEASCEKTKEEPAPAPPADPCKKWKEERKANKEIAAHLKAEVGFGANVVALNSNGKKTLDGVAKTLKKYPWMSFHIQGHSSAPKGKFCTQLVQGRAESTKKYLTSQGVKNKMTVDNGTCAVKKAITIGAQDSIQNAAGAGSPPKGCTA